MPPSIPFNSYYDILLLGRRHNATHPPPHPQLQTSAAVSHDPTSLAYFTQLKNLEKGIKTTFQTNIDTLVAELLRLRRHEQEGKSQRPDVDILRLARDISVEQDGLFRQRNGMRGRIKIGKREIEKRKKIRRKLA